MINGAPLFAKAAVYVPPTTFPSLIDQTQFNGFWDEHHGDLSDLTGQFVKAAANADCNMLTVNSSGMYASDRFYDLCDLYGILVCQEVPELHPGETDDEMLENVRRETAFHCQRIRNFTSMALLAIADNSPLASVARDNANDLAANVAIMDTASYESLLGKPVMAGSSCSGHAWNNTLAPQDRYVSSPAVLWHDRANLIGNANDNFPEAHSLNDFVYFTQLRQAEVLKDEIERHRRNKGAVWGALISQLNDCWPGISRAIIDSERVPKAAYYWAKHFYAPVLVSLNRYDTNLAAYIVNDELHDIAGDLHITLETFEGEVLSSITEHVSVTANSSAKALDFDLAPFTGRERDVVVLAYFDYGRGSHATMFLAKPVDLRLPNPGLTWTLEGNSLTIKSSRFAAYVRVELSERLASKDDLTAHDNFFHMRAGEAAHVHFGYVNDVPAGLADIAVRWL